MHLSWWKRAACRGQDPEIFFDPDLEALALASCVFCPVKYECLAHALEFPEKSGVWGGLTEDQRKKTGVKRNRAKCPGCSSTDVSQLPNRHEVCAACGLSWHV